MILDLAQRHQLSAYDATCLALAANRGMALLTADRHLLDLRSHYPWIVAPADCHQPPALG